ncbi:MAG TPA: bifunctional phosphoribosyl-AMP cyclohydrolase/phosphoribosyl-ATP diphosphatase HisIE [Candidatus Coproplasma stercoripullorum]|uniref:Histidine biosynthesis bifunctional protein HisIE n=1 Tax=Candidatus Coproplasma stercoripullorum TaxID=2840751 RepID=A0A9D1DBP8_9FIRM|nr:bifunctional phosphoribosyl-AMP cyclohydrolase/phosphoribosyl-ATP diphosphatase HisIE [Candidatus Coproplasma stercoripullorum]
MKLLDLDKLVFDKDGLIPAVVQDVYSKKVLTVAYMNRESLEISIKRKLTCFYSRSRKQLWLKGETSGNFQHIVSITADCDMDSLVIEVAKDGPACHLGTDSCFTNAVFENEDLNDFTLDELYDLIKGRKDNPQDGSYTSYLFDKGLDKILKKVGEECTEVVIAAKGGDKGETVFEISDLTYHVLVLMAEYGITLNDIKAQLASRHVIDKKVKQEKMQ